MGDLQLWLGFLDQSTREGLENVKDQAAVVWDMCEGLSSVGLEAANWNQTCKLVILHMLVEILSKHAFQMTLCDKGQFDTQQRSVALMAYLADCPHTPREHKDTLTFVLHPAHMTSTLLEWNLLSCT